MLFNVGRHGGIMINMLFEEETVDNEVFRYLTENDMFSCKYGEIYVSGFEKTVFMGLGKYEDLSYDRMRVAFFNLTKELISKKIREVELYVPSYDHMCTKKLANAIAEGMMQAEYSFDRFKSCKKEKFEITVNYNPEKKVERAEDGIKEAEVLIDSIFTARDLVNLPSNYIYPETLAEKAVDILSPLGVKVTVYNREQIEEIGMHAFLSVAQGSDRDPVFIVMEYMNDPESDEKLGFVGKGITYDSGGYSIKPSDSMNAMFNDMGGAASVIGAMKAIASRKLEINAVAVVAACENLISGHAYKPGDIVNSLSGKTIEVVNTDFEGRLTLADALYYSVNNLKVTKLVDLATLTGGVLMALGELYTGAVTNNGHFFKDVQKAAKMSGEKIWELPFDEEIGKLNESDVADIKNTGGRLSSTASAGMFLHEFVERDTPWVHLDIAGTAYTSYNIGYLPKRATGILVKTLYNLAKKIDD